MCANSTVDALAPPLPMGTVTLLFTDIEGSTRLWETQASAMRTALARHDELLRYAIQAHGGRVFKTAGDAFCAAFPTAPGALGAALEAQRALHREPWPDAIMVRARMALHSGAVELRDGDYFGPPLNTVARLLAVGHGGQTLVSEATHDLCRDHLPPLASVRPLGEHSLKDVSRREAIFQLCHPELPQSFPALKAQLAPLDRDAPSIAVLPFVNMSGDPENEYFADGLAEELLNVLAKIAGLRVVSRTSAFSFKGKGVDIPTVARQLNVATVLEGSVRKAGRRVRVSAQLIQVANDSHLWSETYDRELDDIFAVQDDIAQAVVRALRSALLGEGTGAPAQARAMVDVQKASAGRAGNPEAYRLYLQGIFYLDRATEPDHARAVTCLQQALVIEPEYALAWAGLARAASERVGYWGAPAVEGFDQARGFAQRALELEPDLAEAHVELGRVYMLHDWNWAAADAELRRALALAPGSASVLRPFAQLARYMQRFDEALRLARQAVGLDPLNARAHLILGNCYLAVDRMEDATTSFQRGLDLNPVSSYPQLHLSYVRLFQGRASEALASASDVPSPLWRRVGMALAYHALGRKAESDAALAQIVDQFSEGAACQIAEVHAWRGETDLAFEWLERAFVQRDPGLSYCGVSRLLRSLHGDPRWSTFLAKMGLQ